MCKTLSVFMSLALIWVMAFPQSALATEKNGDNNIKKAYNFNYAPLKEKTIYPAPYLYPHYIPVRQSRIKTRFFMANVSAYTASADECGKSDGITASGKKVAQFHTIACPKEFSFGTKIKIHGYGVFVCEDRGGAIKKNKLDVYVKTKKQAFSFGRQRLLAEVLH